MVHSIAFRSPNLLTQVHLTQILNAIGGKIRMAMIDDIQNWITEQLEIDNIEDYI